MMQEILLSGCAPIPLAGYLKALGVFRLVVEQADRGARGCWRNEQFVLNTRLRPDELLQFFLEQYKPTPILAPWNGGSGFYEGDNKSGIQPLRSANAERFSAIRRAISQMENLIHQFHLNAKPEKELKATFLQAIRANADENLLTWFDAAVLLSDEDAKYPPLLGTGGNDGRLDFTNNFMQRLVDLIDPDTGTARAGESERLSGVLFGNPVSGLTNNAIGQFSPGSAGGPNGSTGFDALPLINPWDFILMLEGAVLFAASATRRLESADEGQLSYPFAVRSTGSGSGSASMSDEGNARAEIWMPLWERSCSLAELKTLLAEGRVTLGRRPARDGLDFVRAIARLGVARGISAFQRYAFLMRSGKAYLATPLNRVPVKSSPDADLIDQLERNQFLTRFRRFARSGSAHAQQLVRRLEDTLFELAGGDARNAEQERARRIQAVLQVLGDILFYLADSPKAREECRYLPELSRDWVLNADDRTAEFRIAAALAGIGAGSSLRMLVHLLPVSSEDPTRFDEQSSLITWRAGSLRGNLVDLLHRRLLFAEKHDFVDKPLDGYPTATPAVISALLQGQVDERRITRLMAGMSLVRDMPRYLPSLPELQLLPAAYAVLKPLFTSNARLHDAGLLAEGIRLPLSKEVPRHLEAGKVEKAIQLAIRRLRNAGISVSFRNIGAAGLRGDQLLAALLLPISNGDLKQIVGSVTRKNNEDQASSAA